jgi:hypothetical protein
MVWHAREMIAAGVLDGARGIAFVEASVGSSRSNGAWTSARIA